ncbi:MAG: phosphopantetheine-binding protein [Lautropia sp.]|nr:phosphopantetheine-binding protein [Lautropia sp.]
MNQLKQDIKTLIIDSLGLEDITPADIADDAPLFQAEGLGLDSVDALELGLALQKKFGFRLESESAALREHFHSVNTLAGFVQSMTAAKG